MKSGSMLTRRPENLRDQALRESYLIDKAGLIETENQSAEAPETLAVAINTALSQCNSDPS
jgi:hypothetical protein